MNMYKIEEAVAAGISIATKTSMLTGAITIPPLGLIFLKAASSKIHQSLEANSGVHRARSSFEILMKPPKPSRPRCFMNSSPWWMLTASKKQVPAMRLTSGKYGASSKPNLGQDGQNGQNIQDGQDCQRHAVRMNRLFEWQGQEDGKESCEVWRFQLSPHTQIKSNFGHSNLWLYTVYRFRFRQRDLHLQSKCHPRQSYCPYCVFLVYFLCISCLCADCVHVLCCHGGTLIGSARWSENSELKQWGVVRVVHCDQILFKHECEMLWIDVNWFATPPFPLLIEHITGGKKINSGAIPNSLKASAVLP